MNSMLRKASLAALVFFAFCAVGLHAQQFDPSQIKFPTGAPGCVYAPGSNTCVPPGAVPLNGSVETGDYTVTTASFVQMNCATPCTVTLPASVTSGFSVAIERTGAGTVTINPNGVTYDGATSIPLQNEFVAVWTDGTGYHSSSPWAIDASLNYSLVGGVATLGVTAGASGAICTASGSGTAQSCTIAGFTLSAPKCFTYSTTTANTGTSLTLDVNGSGAKPIAKWLGNTTLAAGDVPAGKAETVCYDGTNINLMTVGNAPSGASLPSTTNVIKGDGSGGGVAATPGTDYVVPGGNVATATALAANGSNCTGTDFAKGVDPSGNAEGCATPAGGASTAPLSAAQPFPAATAILQALNNASNQVVSIVVSGDSFTVCDITNCTTGPTISTDRWAEKLRTTLQGLYGSHGTGIIPIVLTWGGSLNVNSEAYSVTGTPGTNTSLGPSQTAGIAGNSLVDFGSGTSITFNDSRAIPWDTLHVYGATQTGSGSLVCTGGVTATLTTGSVSATGTAHAGFTPSRWDLTPVSLGTHSVTCTPSGGDFYIYGFQGTAGTAGVEISNVGIGGSDSESVGLSPANKLAFTDLLPSGANAYIYMTLTNDAASSLATGTFQTYLQNLIAHEQALSSTPTVMLAIPGVDIVGTSTSFAPYTAVELGVCAANASMVCVNIQDRGNTTGSTPVGWGTAYNASSGLWDLSGTAWPTGNAGVHPNDKGNLDEAQMIYAALFQPTGPQPATTTKLGSVKVGSGLAVASDGTLSASGATSSLTTLMPSVTPSGGNISGPVFTADGAHASIILDTIPGGYKYLDLTCNLQAALTVGGGIDGFNVVFNGDTAGNYDSAFYGTYGSTSVDGGHSQNVTNAGGSGIPDTSQNGTAHYQVEISPYTSTTVDKIMAGRSTYYHSGVSQMIQYVESARWHPSSIAAIVKITLTTTSGHNFNNTSTCTLDGRN